MDKYNKINNPVTPNYVTYYRFSKSVSHTFTVRYNADDKIDLLSNMEKRINIKGDWTQSAEKGNITKEEFDNVLNQTIQFLADKEQTPYTKLTY